MSLKEQGIACFNQHVGSITQASAFPFNVEAGWQNVLEERGVRAVVPPELPAVAGGVAVKEQVAAESSDATAQRDRRRGGGGPGP